jgi:hypothetical protein
VRFGRGHAIQSAMALLLRFEIQGLALAAYVSNSRSWEERSRH